MIEFPNKVDSIVFKLQSADEIISDNLKIAIVLKALPQECDSFIAAIHFQQISYIQLKERLIERSLGGSSNKQDMSSTSIATPAIHRTREDDTMEELDKGARKPCTVQSVDVAITLLTAAMQSSL